MKRSATGCTESAPSPGASLKATNIAPSSTYSATIGVAGHGIMAVPTDAWTGIAKYPLLALPVFVLAGMVFERSGVAIRLVRFAAALVGDRQGGLGLVAIIVCMVLGGISGSGPADAAAVANGEALKPTPELERLLRERFTPEGKAERVARSLAALAEAQRDPIKLSREQWKVIAEDPEVGEQ